MYNSNSNKLDRTNIIITNRSDIQTTRERYSKQERIRQIAYPFLFAFRHFYKCYNEINIKIKSKGDVIMNKLLDRVFNEETGEINVGLLTVFYVGCAIVGWSIGTVVRLILNTIFKRKDS